jgi:release factor glutamine methyltransferase
MTLQEWLEGGTARLEAGPHPDRARRDAETLLLHLIGKNRAWLLTHLTDDFAGCTAIRFATLLDRRVKGEPIQHITGESEFYGLPFRINCDVLIPRPETEHLIERVVKLAPLFRKPRIVDVGTGSGAIAIALANECPDATVTATDTSEPALKVARGNAERLGFAGRIRFLQGDLLAPVSNETFDIVVSNPPYVPSSDRDSLAVEVREYEPAGALFAGDDGLRVYRRLIPAAFALLAPSGFIALEIGYGQQEDIRMLLTQTGFTGIQFMPDLQGIARVTSASKRSVSL